MPIMEQNKRFQQFLAKHSKIIILFFILFIYLFIYLFVVVVFFVFFVFLFFFVNFDLRGNVAECARTC